MATFKVRKVVTMVYEAEIKARNYDKAEEKARYDDKVEWEDMTEYGYNEDYDIDKEDW